MTNGDRLLTIKEAAEFLHVHWQTVRSYVANGKLKSVKAGRSVRILESDLKQFLGAAPQKEEKYEIEIRFLTNKRQTVEERLIKMGARIIYQGHVIDHWFVPNQIRNLKQKDEWFDNAKGYGLRIREQDNGYTGRITTTLEVKRLAVPYEHNTCIEGEVSVDNYKETEALLRLMNNKEMVTLDKDRLVYKTGELKVVIDDIKNFKTGVEIEAVTGEERLKVIPRLMKLARDLGLDTKKEITSKSVTYLYMQQFAKFK